MPSVSKVREGTGKDFLECGICMERYTHPKILCCVHSFCEKCLVKHYGNDQVKPCPTCRQETKLPVPGGVSGLKTNGFLIKLSDKHELLEKVAITSDKGKRKCELCTENEVTHHCLNCSQNFCASCKNFHPRIKGMADHTVGTLKDIREGKVTLPDREEENRCNIHGEINRFYCNTCHLLICDVCIGEEHSKPKHQYIDCAAASTKYRRVLKKVFPTFNGEVEILKKQLEVTSKAQQYFQKNVTQTVQEVNRRAERLISKVKAEEDRVIGKIRTMEQDRNTTFDGHIKTMESLLQRKQHTLTLATDVTTKGSDSDFLSLFSTINHDLSFLRSQVTPQIDGRLHYLRLDQSPTTPRPIKLGELDLGDTKWELHLEVGRDRTEELQFDSVFGIAALRRDRLVVTATRQRLVMFNIAGELEKTIQIGGSPYSVAASLDRIAVVDNTKCVKMFNEDLTPTIQFRTLHQRELNKIEAHLMCVCMKKDGSTLIGHASKNVITSHSPDGACVNTIPVKARFLTTDSQDRIVLTGYDDNGVIVVGTDGAMLLNMKPTIDGQPVSYSRGVCCDGSDIYVAVSNLDSGSGHIHRYDGDGKFLSCIVQGLRDPQGITLTEDGQHLAVVDSGLVKIYHRV